MLVFFQTAFLMNNDIMYKSATPMQPNIAAVFVH